MSMIIKIGMYALFAIVIGVLSTWPSYEMVEQDRAIISLVFKHAGARIGECHQRSQEELNELPPNMREPVDCPRERHPVRIEMRTGDSVLYRETLLPSGIWADGKANVYQRIEVTAGTHKLFVAMNDSGTNDRFDYSKSLILDIEPGRNVVLQFDEEAQQFSIR